MARSIKLPEVGDLVVLHKTNRTFSMVLWSSWHEYDYNEPSLNDWPTVVGYIKENEVALVIEIAHPLRGLRGAKIYTYNNVIGWISSKHLRKIKR